ncbi:MAG: hypothetical protein ACYC7D_06465 [Nitrososphaerales archaeon]
MLLLVFGILLGMVSASFLGNYDKLAVANPISKSLNSSFLTLIILTGLATLLHLNAALNYFLLGIAVNTSSYFALGVVIGYVHEKLFDDAQMP